MSNLPQNGAELKALLEAETTPTRESKVIIGAKTKAEMLNDQSSKQSTVQQASQNKQTQLNAEAIPQLRVDTSKVSFDEFAKNFSPETSNVDIEIQYYKNKQLDNELRQALYAQQAEATRPTSLGEDIKDTALSTSKIGVTTGQMALGIADLAGRVVGIDNMGDKLNRATGAVLGKDKLIPNDAIEQIDANMSSKMQAQQKLVQQEVQAAKLSNMDEIKQLGEKATWWDKAKNQGEEFGVQIAALADNPRAMADVALSSALAFTVPAVVGKAARHYAAKQGIKDLDKVAEWGAVAGTAGLEGFSQAYEEKQKVLDMPVDELAKNSPKFNEYVDKYGVEKAKQMIADNVYMSNLGFMAIASAAASKLTGAGKLEKDLFVGSDLVADTALDTAKNTTKEIATAILKEGAEESLQSAAGTLVQNEAVQRLVNENQTLEENLGASVATGLAGAVVTTGTLSTVANAGQLAAKGATKAVQKAAQKVVDTNNLNTAITEAVTSGNFETVSKIETHTPEQKAEMLLSENVLSKATPQQKLSILNYVDGLLSDVEVPEEPVTKKEVQQAELINNAKEAKVEAGKQVVEPILGNLDSLTIDDEDTVIKVLGSSANSFSDDDLVNLSSSVSEDNKPIIDAVIQSRKDINDIEVARENKDIVQVNQDVINGGKGFLGLRNYQEKFEQAINSGSTDKATKAVEMLNNFTKLQAQKLADIQFIYQLAQEGVGTLALDNLNKQYREKYNLPEGNSIHRGSGKFVNTVAMEVKALTSSYKAMGAIYQKATGQSPLVLPAVSTSFSVPSGVVKTVQPSATVSPVKVEPSAPFINNEQVNVSDQLTEDTAQAIVSERQSQPTAAPETPKEVQSKSASEEKQTKPVIKKITKNSDIASDEVSDIRRVLREQQDAPSKLLDILMKYNDESSYIHQLAKKLKSHSLIDNLSFDDATKLENKPDNAGGIYHSATHSVSFKDSVFKEIFRGLTDRVPFSYITDNTDPNSEEGLTAAPYLVLHELIHAVTVEAIANAWKTDGLYEELLDIQSSIRKWVKNNKEFLNKKENSVLAHRLSLILEKEEELVTYGLTDVDVINLMKQLPSTKSKNLYTQFVKLIRSIIGISDKDASLFDDILSLTEKLMDTQNKNKSIVPVEEAKPVASSEAATATEAAADETTEPVQEDASKVEAPVEAPKKLTRQRIFELVSEGVIEPVNKIMRKVFVKEDVNQEGINKAVKEYSSRLGKSMKRLGEERIKERIASFSKGIQDAVDYKVDTESKDKDYLEGVKTAQNNIKFNTAKATISNRIFDNAIGKFFKAVNKDTVFNKTPLLHLALRFDEKFKTLATENQEVIKNFLSFRTKFNNSLVSFAKKPYNLNSVMAEGKNDYVHLFMNEAGAFDDAFVTAMSLAAHNWLTQSATSLVSLDHDQVVDLLGLPENTELSPQIVEVFSRLGTTRETVADDLGKAVISIMGYQFNKSITEAEQTNMHHSIGLMVIATLQDTGYVEIKPMMFQDFINAGLSEDTLKTRLNVTRADNSFAKTVYLRPVTKMQPIPSKDDTENQHYYEGMQDDIHEAMTLARNERLAEVEPILNKLFDVEDAKVDPVFTKPTKFTNKVKNSKRKKQSAKQQEAVQAMSQRPWGMSSVANVFMSFSAEAQQTIAGFKTDEEIAKLHVTERETAKTNNNSIMRTIGYFTDFYNSAAERDFYLPVFVAVNNRMFYGTNTINPQTNKIIRRLITLKDNVVKVNLSNKEHEQNFRIALMDAFAIKANWKNIVEDYQQGNDKLTKFLANPVVQAAVDGILSGDMQSAEKDILEAVKLVTDEGGNGYHAVQGLIALAQEKQAKGKPFETDLLVEIDGVANGVAILMWQFAGTSKENFETAMNRAGVYQEGDVTSFTEYAGKGNYDSYQELTKYWNIALDSIQNVLLGGVPDVADELLLRTNENDGMIDYWDNKNAEESIKAVHTLTGNNKQASYALLSSLRALIGPLVDENGAVTSVGRNLAKSPTMTSSYNAGFDSVMENVLNYVLSNVYATLQKYPLKDEKGEVILANQQKLAELSNHINSMFGQGTVSFETDNSRGVSNLEWTIDSISKDAKQNFDTLLKNTFGWGLRASLNKVYGRLLDNRTVASEVAQYAFLTFKAIYENTVDRYLEANQKDSLSIEDKEIIMDQLKDIWPVLHTQSSVNPEEAILLFKEKTRKVYARTGDAEADKKKVKAFTVTQEYSRPLNNNGQAGFKSASAVGKETVLEEPGASTVPVATQSIDAHSMFVFQQQFAALNVHDAVGVPISLASFLGSEMNAAFQDVAMGQYNIEGELTLVMQKFMDLAKQYKVDQKVWTQFNTTKDKTTGLLKVKEEKRRKYKSAGHLLAKIQDNFNKSQEIRESFTPYAVSQYDLVGAAKINGYDIVSDAEAHTLPAQIISEINNELGSKPQDNAKEDYSNATVETLNADNTIEIFDRLADMGLVEENQKNTESLRSLLQEVVNKVITPITYVLGEVNSDTRGKYIETLRGLRIEQAIGNTTYGMSAQEVYVHELVHAIVRNSLSSGTVTVKRVTAMFDAVKSLVDEGKITYVDFLPLDDNGKTITNPTTEQVKDAQDRLDYIFNNAGVRIEKIRDLDTGFLTTVKYNASLEEFVAFGVTNEAFKNTLNRKDVAMALKLKMKAERTKTASNSRVVKVFDGMVNWLFDLVQEMLDKLTDKVFGLNGKAMDDQLVVLVSQLAGATGKHQSKVMQMLDSITEHRTAATAKLKQWVAQPLIKVAQSNMVKGSRIKAVRVSGRLIGALNNSQAGQWTKALRQVRSRIKITEDNFAQAIAQEMVGVTSKNRVWHKMLRISNKDIDQLRKHIQTVVKNVLNEQFATSLSVEQKKAMTSVVMRTDISVLLGLGYTHEQIQDFIKDKSLLDAEVIKLSDVFMQTYKLGEGRWMMNQAKNLARFMVTGESNTPNALMNAHNIARRFGRGKTPQPINEVAAENELEVLISLMALQMTEKDEKDLVIDVLNSELSAGKKAEENGLTYVLEFHKNYVEESIGTNFKGDKTQTIKGYVKEQYDPNIDVKYGDNKPETVLAYKKMGYENTGIKVQTDGLQGKQTTEYIYVNNSAKLATNSVGIVSLTSTNSMGTDLTDKTVMNADIFTNVGLDTYLETKDIEQAMLIRSNMLMGQDTVPETNLIPTFDSNGNVKRYRYVMNLANSRKLLEIQEGYDDLLAHMQAHIKDKENTEQINNLVVKTLKQEFDDEFSKSPKEFTYIGPDSPNPKMKELWFTLPESMRLEVAKHFKGKKGFYVKTRNVRLIFGFRKFTIGELFKRKDAIGNANKTMLNMAGSHIHALLNKPLVHNAEEMWQEVVRMAKDTIVVKTGATLAGNIVSNMAVLATEGVAVSDMIKYGMIAWKGAAKYQKDRSKLDRMKFDLANKTSLTQQEVAKLKREIALTENQLSTNPVFELIDAGIYQTIVEDVDMDDNPFSFKSKLERNTDKITKHIPETVKDVGKILFMAHDTQLYKAMRNATQVSDFVGRFILHEHNKNKLKMDKEASIDNIVETFVNYDLPTHRSIQYLNDMGFIMFSKFFMRIQKVIVRQLSTRLANVIGLLTIQQLLGIDIADIFDGNIFAENIISGKFASPDDHLDTLIGLHLFNNF